MDQDPVTLSLIAIGVLGFKFLKKRRKRKKRSCWSRKWLLRRDVLGVSNTLLKELASEDIESYKNWMRMDQATFHQLLEKVRPYIAKSNTNMRDCISAEDRLAVTLRYLATGKNLLTLVIS
jgi:hypothetical protein